MNCPACNSEFKRLKNEACPNCETELKVVSYTENGKRKRAVQLANQPEVYNLSGEQADPKDLLPGNLGILISDALANPQVFVIDQGSKSNSGRYRVVYRSFIPVGWINCPACHRKMFQNMTSYTSGSQEHLCRACKVKVEFVFVKIA